MASAKVKTKQGIEGVEAETERLGAIDAETEGVGAVEGVAGTAPSKKKINDMQKKETKSSHQTFEIESIQNDVARSL